MGHPEHPAGSQAKFLVGVRPAGSPEDDYFLIVGRAETAKLAAEIAAEITQDSPKWEWAIWRRYYGAGDAHDSYGYELLYRMGGEDDGT